MRGFRHARRVAAAALLAAMVAVGAAPHRHAGLGEESPDAQPSQSVLTTHNPLSSARHWHAVVRVVQEDPCWACHWQRVFGLPAAVVPLGTVSPSRALALLPPRAAISVARFTRLSRGPPSVL